MCCSPWGRKESDTTKQLNNNNIYGLPWLLRVKNLPAMQENWVRSLGGEDPVAEGMATHSSILAWGIPWTEELGGLQSNASQRVGHD